MALVPLVIYVPAKLEIFSFNLSRDIDDEGPKIYKLVHVTPSQPSDLILQFVC